MVTHLVQDLQADRGEQLAQGERKGESGDQSSTQRRDGNVGQVGDHTGSDVGGRHSGKDLGHEKDGPVFGDNLDDDGLFVGKGQSANNPLVPRFY